MTKRLLLVADDNPDVRNISRTILESRGFSVVQAVNGAEAVEIAKDHRPDLIFLDIIMPEVDGWAAIALLKGDAETRDIPVVAITTSDPAQERVRDAGFCGLVTKPVSPPELVEAVAICLEAHEEGDRWIPNLAERVRAAR